ncbi:uncharacterized protein LOC18029576 [Eutrema salsugineum]|uniref:uncharacterized protein LOC18029576 n=1 Tax=Eutrema salsugineum TaxID=72664 RepID=UPI000CECF25A|nr:uncharacterized protein LOC18029576 [Eutrema salsugineum]
MVEKSLKLSSKNTTPVEITSQALATRPLARNIKFCGKKGAFPSRQSNGDLAEDLSKISDDEVAGNLNNKKEFLLNKIAWELMNPDYQKEKHRKSTTVKKKDPMNKTALSKKTLAARTGSNAENENKKRLTSDINYDVLDKLFDDEKAPKRAKLEKPIGDQMESLQQSSEECLLEPQGSEEEEPDWNEDYSNDDDDGRVKEFDGDADLEFEDEGEDNEDIIW